MSIAADFADFGSDIGQLRKKLRGLGAELHDSFPPYGAWFRRRFGIDNEQALELFHQTVSMKSVGNLTDFVRSHMLEPSEVEPRITALINHFDDLNRAHDAVLKAKRQMSLLTPLVADCQRHTQLNEQTETLRACREALRPFFAGLKRGLLEKRLAGLDEELARQNTQLERLNQRKRQQQLDERELQRNIAANGGDRIAQLGLEIERLQDELARRRDKSGRYQQLLQSLDLPAPADAEAFLAQQMRFTELRESAEVREADLQNQANEIGVAFAQGRSEHQDLQNELASLKARRSNIEDTQIKMRQALCRALNLAEDEMPFAGELIQVRDEDKDWEAPPNGCCAISVCRCWCRMRITRRWPIGWSKPICAAAWFTSGSGRACAATCRSCTAIRWHANWRSNPIRRFTIGWSARSATASTWPAARPRSNFAASKKPSPAPARSRRPANATKKTTATASTTAAAMCWAGATPPRSPRWRTRPSCWKSS